MMKNARQFAIKQLIRTKEIPSQNGLRRELRKMGFDVTQATLSRDLQHLGIARFSGGEHAKYVMPQAPVVSTLRPLVGAEILAIDANENIVVVRTLPGCANTVAEYVDVLKYPGVIGTVAGDNTLLVIPKSKKTTKHLVHFLRKKLVEGK